MKICLIVKNNSRCDKAYIDLCQDHIDFNSGMSIDAGELMSIINDFLLQ